MDLYISSHLLLGLIPESPLNQEKMSRVRSFNEDGLFRNFLHKYGLPNRIFLRKNKKRDVRGGETKNWIGKCSDNDDVIESQEAKELMHNRSF